MHQRIVALESSASSGLNSLPAQDAWRMLWIHGPTYAGVPASLAHTGIAAVRWRWRSQIRPRRGGTRLRPFGFRRYRASWLTPERPIGLLNGCAKATELPSERLSRFFPG